MDPVSNQLFSYNFQKFVLQEPDVRAAQPSPDIGKRPFEQILSKKPSRTKKDTGKQKN